MKAALAKAVNTTEETANLSTILMGLGAALDQTALTYRNTNGGTLLHECIRHNTHPAVFAMMLNQCRSIDGFDTWLNQTNADQQTPAQLAKEMKATEKARLLAQLISNDKPLKNESTHKTLAEALAAAVIAPANAESCLDYDDDSEDSFAALSDDELYSDIDNYHIDDPKDEYGEDACFSTAPNTGEATFATPLRHISSLTKEAESVLTDSNFSATHTTIQDVTIKMYHGGLMLSLSFYPGTSPHFPKFIFSLQQQSQTISPMNDDNVAIEPLALHRKFIQHFFERISAEAEKQAAQHEKQMNTQAAYSSSNPSPAAAIVDANGEPINYIVMFANHFIEFIDHPTYFCEHCSDKLTFDDAALEQDHKFLPCESDFCQFRADTMQLNKVNLLDLAKTKPLVLDLLICLTYSATQSHRKAIMCDPFPEAFLGGENADESNASSNENPHKNTDKTDVPNKDFDGLANVLGKLPKIKDWDKQPSEAALEKYLNECTADARAYHLVQWIVITNRAAMQQTAVSPTVKAQGFDYQFQLLFAAPRKQALFQRNKASITKRQKSLTAYHGSAVSNWHRILRDDVKNCSGSHLETTGAAYGAGVYMTDDKGIATSVDTYSRAERTWPNSAMGNGRYISVLAIMELLNHPNLKAPSPYYVEPDDSMVRIDSLAVKQI